jgi:dehydrodolichyl diphosphate syntase complex subunit NUS1
LTLLLLSSTDGRETLVDLTKTLADMAQHDKLSPQDISVKLIDAEIGEITSPPTPPPAEHLDPSCDEASVCSSNSPSPPATTAIEQSTAKSEPDLLLIFGPYVKLDGYPPWQLRLTEIYCTGDKSSSITGDGEAVEYQRLLKGLWRYAKAEMRFGR